MKCSHNCDFPYQPHTDACQEDRQDLKASHTVMKEWIENAVGEFWPGITAAEKMYAKQRWDTPARNQIDALRAKLAESEGERDKIDRLRSDGVFREARLHSDKIKLEDRLALAERVVEAGRRVSPSTYEEYEAALAAYDAEKQKT